MSDAIAKSKGNEAIILETFDATTLLRQGGSARAVDCLPRPDQWWLEAPVMTHPPVSLRSS